MFSLSLRDVEPLSARRSVAAASGTKPFGAGARNSGAVFLPGDRADAASSGALGDEARKACSAEAGPVGEARGVAAQAGERFAGGKPHRRIGRSPRPAGTRRGRSLAAAPADGGEQLSGFRDAVLPQTWCYPN